MKENNNIKKNNNNIDNKINSESEETNQKPEKDIIQLLYDLIDSDDF